MFFASIQNKVVRMAVRILVIFMVVVLLLLIVVNIYVRSNKEEILSTIEATINKNVAGRFDAKDIEVSAFIHFPNIAIDLKNVRLEDTVYHKPLLECRDLSCRFSIFKIFDIQHQAAKLVIEHGKINFFIDSMGFNNTSMFRKNAAQKKEGKESFIIHALDIQDVDVLATNAPKGKIYDFHINEVEAGIKQKDSITYFDVDNDILVNKLIFNQKRGSFLEHDEFDGHLLLNFNKSNKVLSCAESRIRVDDQPYVLKAAFDFSPAQTFNLDITATELHYEKAINALTPQLRQKLNTIQLINPIYGHIVLNGPLKGGQNPLVNIEWNTANNEFNTGTVVFDNCSFNGTFTNQMNDTMPRNDESSQITLKKFSGDWKGLHLNGTNIIVTNLTTPSIQFVLESSESLQEIDNAIGSDDVSFLDGSASVVLSYSGPLINDPIALKDLTAQLLISNGSIRYEPKNILLERCSGEITIDNNQIHFKNFEFDFRKNHFAVNAAGNELANLSDKNPGKTGIVLNISSPYLHIDEIFDVLAPPGTVVKKTDKKKLLPTAYNIDNLFANSSWLINFTTNKVSKGNFYAAHMKANIAMQDNVWQIKNLSMEHAGGLVTASGQLDEKKNGQALLSTDMKLDKVNVQQLFEAFNDFGQRSISSKNIRGVLTADAHVSLSLNSSNKVIPRTMTGYADFSLKNGAIVDHKGLQEIKLLFLKNRDMSNVKFAELKDGLDITPDYIYINRMEIASSAIDMYLEGRYDLYGQNTDMLIQIPFSNLGKHDDSEIPQNKGLDAKTGLSFWIRAKNTDDGDIKLSPTFSKKIKPLK